MTDQPAPGTDTTTPATPGASAAPTSSQSPPVVEPDHQLDETIATLRVEEPLPVDVRQEGFDWDAAAAIGALLAVVVALALALGGALRSRWAAAYSEDREQHARANAVVAWGEPHAGAIPPSWDTHVRNDSGLPVFAVSVLVPNSAGTLEQGYTPIVLPNAPEGRTTEVTVPTVHPAGTRWYRVEFTDTNGTRWRREGVTPAKVSDVAMAEPVEQIEVTWRSHPIFALRRALGYGLAGWKKAAGR